MILRKLLLATLRAHSRPSPPGMKGIPLWPVGAVKGVGVSVPKVCWNNVEMMMTCKSLAQHLP